MRLMVECDIEIERLDIGFSRNLDITNHVACFTNNEKQRARKK
jgi:hypothetical protein